jgi:hypothetical protein
VERGKKGRGSMERDEVIRMKGRRILRRWMREECKGK